MFARIVLNAGSLAFTASELGLSERTVERASNGANIMKPAATPPVEVPAPVLNTAIASPVAPPVDPATAYYNLGAPKGQKAATPVAVEADPVKTS